MKALFSSELIEKYREGERSFSNVIIQYADFLGTALQDIHIKNSRLVFATFRNCALRNARFSNCEIFFGSFYGGDLTNAVFDNCEIKLTLFESAIFNNTKIVNSNISYSGMFNTNIRELDMSSAIQYKVFTDISQITEKDIESGMSLIAPYLSHLDAEIRKKIMKIIQGDAARYNFKVPIAETQKSGYSSITSSYQAHSPV